jgi:hypothetical protein
VAVLTHRAARRIAAAALVAFASLALVGVMLPQASVPAAPPGESLEYRVKAAYLMNFTRYVEWPSTSFQDASEPFRICVLGTDPFGRVLDATLMGRTIQGRPLSSRRIRTVRQADACHVVFVSGETWRSEPELLKHLSRSGVLTVGESEQFARDGGVIGFIILDETVRFVVNASARDRAGLRISSRMLSLAAAVYNGTGGGL